MPCHKLAILSNISTGSHHMHSRTQQGIPIGILSHWNVPHHRKQRWVTSLVVGPASVRVSGRGGGAAAARQQRRQLQRGAGAESVRHAHVCEPRLAHQAQLQLVRHVQRLDDAEYVRHDVFRCVPQLAQLGHHLRMTTLVLDRLWMSFRRSCLHCPGFELNILNTRYIYCLHMVTICNTLFHPPFLTPAPGSTCLSLSLSKQF